MKTFEIIMAIALLVLAVWLFLRAVSSKSKGVSNCGTCAAKCPNRDTGEGCGELVFLNRPANDKTSD